VPLIRRRLPPALQEICLDVGSHATREDGVCALEAVAWIAGEPHSDRPACVSRVLASFVRYWNDLGADRDREALKLFLVRLVGTADCRDRVRARIACDWLTCHCAPTWVEACGEGEYGTVLRVVGPVRERSQQATVAAVCRAASPQLACRIETDVLDTDFQAAIWASIADHFAASREPTPWWQAARAAWDMAWAARYKAFELDPARAAQVALVLKLDALACFDSMIDPPYEISRRRYSASAASWPTYGTSAE
jgi:hypothetical protein